MRIHEMPTRNLSASFAMKQITRRAALAGLSAVLACPAIAKSTWPDRAITLVHGFPPGGPVDVLARILAEPLSQSLGQPVTIESKPGATGMMAAGMVARAVPDGYTLLALPGTFTAASAMLRSLSFNPAEDLTFISSTAESPLVLVSNPDSELRSLGDLARVANARGTPLQYGTAGIGSIQHLTMELIARKLNLNAQHIPYKGGMPAITDLLGNRIDLVLDPPTALLPFAKDGKLRALATTGSGRFFGLPDVPSLSEAGYATLVVTVCQGLAAPARLPTPIIERINGAVADVLVDAAVIEKLKKIGSSPRPSSAQEYKIRVASDIALWSAVITDAHIERI